MKIYKIISHSGSIVTIHGFFDYVEAMAKISDLAFKDNIDKIEILFDNVKTYDKKEKP